MARKSKLSNQQWQELTQLRANGCTYRELSEKFGITRKTITDHILKQDTAYSALTHAVAVLADQDTPPDVYDATKYDDDTKAEVNQFVHKNTTMVNRLVNLHDEVFEVSHTLLSFIKAGLSDNKISVNDLGKLTKYADSVSRQIERMSRVYGMGTPHSQINVQMNQNNCSSDGTKQRPKFNKWGQPLLPDDELTGHETVEIIFCTSNEQAAILQSKQCAKCGGEVENTIS